MSFLIDDFLCFPGRSPETAGIGLETIGVTVDVDSGYIVGGHNDDSERTSVNNIYAIGDVLKVGCN